MAENRQTRFYGFEWVWVEGLRGFTWTWTWSRKCLALPSSLQGTQISHLGKRKIIFECALVGDMVLPTRVTRVVKLYKVLWETETIRAMARARPRLLWLRFHTGLRKVCLMLRLDRRGDYIVRKGIHIVNKLRWKLKCHLWKEDHLQAIIFSVAC